MEDCIHIRACRRLSKIAKSKGMIFARGCNEKCTAYVNSKSESSYVTVEEALKFARDGAGSIQSGYDKYDVWCACDLDGIAKDLGEIIEEQ